MESRYTPEHPGEGPAASSKRPLIAALMLVITMLYAVVQLYYAFDWAKEDFAGFLVHRNLIVGPDNSPEWPGRPAGMKYYDHILSADGQPLHTSDDLYEFIAKWVEEHGPGVSIPYRVERWGEYKTVMVPPATFNKHDLWIVMIPVFIVGVICLLAAILIFYMRPDAQPASLAFISTLYLVGLWFISVFDYQTNHRFLMLMLTILCVLPATLVHLSITFPRPWRFVERHPWSVTIPYVAAGVQAALNFYFFYNRPEIWRVFDYASTIQILLCVLLFMACITIAVVTAKEPLDRLRAKTILLGSFVAFFVPAILALVTDTPYYLLALFMAAFPISVAYCMVKHNLFDVDIMIRRGVEYTVLTGFTVLVYLILVALFGRVFRLFWEDVPSLDLLFIGFGLVVAISFNSVRGHVQAVIDRVFFRSRFDYRETIHSLCSSLSSVMDLDEVLSHITRDLMKTMHLESVRILLKEEQSGVFREASPRDSATPPLEIPQDHALVNVLARRRGPAFIGEILRLDVSAAERLRCLEGFESLKVRMVLPFIVKNQVIGILALGNKRTGALFSSEDVELLQTLTAAGSVAIENAQTLEKIRRTSNELNSLRKLGVAIGSVKDLETLISLTLNTLCNDMDFEEAAMLLVTSHDNVTPADCWVLRKNARQRPIRLRVPLAKLPPAMSKAVFPGNAPELDPAGTNGGYGALAGFHGEQSKVLLLPLGSESEPIGLIALKYPAELETVSDSQYHVVKTLVDGVTSAVRYTQLHDLLDGITNHSPSATALLDERFRLVFENAAFGDAFPIASGQGAGGDVFDRLGLSPKSRAAVLNHLTLTKQGTHVPPEVIFEDNKYLRYYCFRFGEHGRLHDHIGLVAQDITEEYLMREQLLHSEKVAAVGQVISGVAHELNNPLAGVIGYLDLVLTEGIGEKSVRFLERANESAIRCKKIVENLVNFVRKSKAKLEPTCCNDLTQKTIELLSYQLRVENIRVEMTLDPRLPTTMVDKNQIQQVLLNLFNNAFYAMKNNPNKRECVLSLKTSHDPEARTIQIRVSDTGPGVPGERKEQVFTPFFTTKPAGEGTGLGLSLSHSIIQEHKGSLALESEGGLGATFIITLPISSWVPVAPPEEPAPLGPSNHARFLVVDDEEAIRLMMQRMLEKEGHSAIAAEDGQAAIELLDSHQFDYVLTDIKMPRKDGIALYRELIARDPALKGRCIVVTGDTIAKETEQFLAESGLPVVAKPFSKQDLLRTIAQLRVKFEGAVPDGRRRTPLKVASPDLRGTNGERREH